MSTRCLHTWSNNNHIIKNKKPKRFTGAEIQPNATTWWQVRHGIHILTTRVTGVLTSNISQTEDTILVTIRRHFADRLRFWLDYQLFSVTRSSLVLRTASWKSFHSKEKGKGHRFCLWKERKSKKGQILGVARVGLKMNISVTVTCPYPLLETWSHTADGTWHRPEKFFLYIPKCCMICLMSLQEKSSFELTITVMKYFCLWRNLELCTFTIHTQTINLSSLLNLGKYRSNKLRIFFVIFLYYGYLHPVDHLKLADMDEGHMTITGTFAYWPLHASSAIQPYLYAYWIFYGHHPWSIPSVTKWKTLPLTKQSMLDCNIRNW
jgi:hypothetical protein